MQPLLSIAGTVNPSQPLLDFDPVASRRQVALTSLSGGWMMC